MALVHKIEPGEHISLKTIDPAETHGIDRADCESRMAVLNQRLADLEEVHYAAGQNGILIVLQGLDTAGKDGTIRHVMTQFNPASCRVEAFKVPTQDELAHDFLWRIHRATPPAGSITIFNRSHYEQVLVVRVHKLEAKEMWERHYEQINHFERLLTECGTLVLKFFLYISKDEQRKRLLAREEDKDKAWKLSPTDWPEHELYNDYVDAYEDALHRCSTDYAPWYVVPSDHKWFRNLAVAQTILDVLEPYRKEWKKAVEARGRAALKARAAQKAAGHAP
jgi:PPK2 family polyphosphate:nucleotide phosphotransferase